MPRLTIFFGIALILLSIISVGLTGVEGSPTKYIPAVFGVLLGACGAVASKPSARKHAMHLAAMVGMIGAVAGGGRAAMGIAKWARGEAIENQLAFTMVCLMAILCAAFVGLCIRSFIQARRSRTGDPQA